MCGLCRVLGGPGHWSDAIARDGMYTRNHTPQERRRERANRTRIANLVLKTYGLKLEDWQSNTYVLRTLTGKSEVFDSLNHLWPVAEKLIGRRCDPLDEELIVQLERRE
jgi:hypothetical protein